VLREHPWRVPLPVRIPMLPAERCGPLHVSAPLSKVLLAQASHLLWLLWQPLSHPRGEAGFAFRHPGPGCASAALPSIGLPGASTTGSPATVAIATQKVTVQRRE
jgi:hypothetical protein